MRRSLTASVVAGAAAGALVLAGAGVVQAGSAPPGPDGGGVAVAAGLTNPRGFTWDADGNLVVALAGSGGPNQQTEDSPSNQFLGPMLGGPTGAVAVIGADGCPTALATGLPSTMAAAGDVLGAEDVAYLDGELYVAADGGGPTHGNDQPSGVYRLTGDGGTELVADLSAWVRENPVANVPADYDPDAAGYSMVVDPASGTLWVGDPNSGQIISVAADGTIARVADLSAGHPVPTRLALDPNGGVYIGTLTAFPFTDGTAGVLHVAPDGTVTTVWTGLTMVVDVAVGADGSLYALQMSTGNTPESPFNPMTGQLVRQTGPDTHEVVVGGLLFPIAMEIGADGSFYVALPAIGANDGSGVIVRLGGGSSPAGSGAPAEGATSTVAECAPIPETISMVPPGGSAAPGSSTPAG
jgi:hypothetical protein